MNRPFYIHNTTVNNSKNYACALLYIDITSGEYKFYIIILFIYLNNSYYFLIAKQ